MSNRDSLGFGELLPQDVVDIFAQEKHSKRGRKKRSHSLGRALGWLKGKKRKDLNAKGQGLGLGPALDLALDGHPAGHQGGHKGGQKSGKQAHPQAVPKRDDDDDKTPAPPLFQENVFIEGSRPKYLENLHTEALEGLKMMQQEETNNGVEYQDNESTISTMTVHTDGEGGGFMTDSTIADTSSVVSVQSSVSTRSSRSGLTRQDSTFRPLNSGKKSEKNKRRRHRKTVAGIPQHVQRELGLDRVGWTLTQKLDEEQLYNGETDDSPTAEGLKGASSNLQGMSVFHPLNKDQLEQLAAANAGHRDDLALLHHLGPDLSDEQRPRSLAVPWMTTANSLQPELPSPVITTSPQAAYMSKIIPNAVLPPSIEVVEISRGRSRNSVRTVSKSSLVLSSPAPSRASSRASSSRASNITSVSRQNPPNVSDSSGWSNSESSETLVSDSSTISTSSTPRQKRSQEGDASAKEDKISVHSSTGKASNCTSNGKLIIKGDDVKKEGPFARSLSVMKPKRAPPPPNRSYSLHNKMKRRSRDLAEVRVISGESSLHSISAPGDENETNKPGSSPMSSKIIDSPGYNADTSSLDDSTGSVSFSPTKSRLEEARKIEETVSKDASQEKQEPLQENKLSKIVTPSSGYSSQDGASAQVFKQPHSSSPRHKRGLLAKLQRLFPGSSPTASTPPALTQPKAPGNTKSTEDLKSDLVDTASVSPSVRTLRELFNIPPPPKVHAPPPPPPEVWAHSKRTFELLLGPPAPDNIQAIIKKNPKDRRQQRQSASASTESSVKSLVVERKHKAPIVTAESINGSLHVLETERKKVQESEILNAEIHKESRSAELNVDFKGNSKVTEEEEKVRVSDILNGMLVKAVEKREQRLAAVRNEEAKKTSIQAPEIKTKTDTLPAISLVHIPPSPSPIHHPPQAPTKQTAEVVSPESSWPPPPPPIGQVGLSDEIDFPLPPPPMFGEGLVVPVQVPPERSIPGGDSSCTTMSVTSVECVRVTTEAEPQNRSTSQGIRPPPLSIPPPPPYTAPPPPVEAVPPPTTKVVSLLPPLKEVSPPPSPKKVYPPLPPEEVFPPPPKEVSLPPPEEIPPPPPKDVSPPAQPKEVSPPPPKEISPPPPKEVPPSPPKEISLPPPEEIPPPPPKDVSPPPLPKEVSPPPPKEISLPPPEEIPPPPPPKEVSPASPKEISPPPSKEVAPSPLPKEVSPPPPKEVSPPPLHEEVSPVRPKESSPPLAPLPLVTDISPTLVTVVSPLPVKEAPPPLVIKVSAEKVSPPSSQENASQSSKEETLSKITSPESIPPPPTLPSQSQSSEHEIDLPKESISSESETITVSANSILTPPQSIPPPPPVQLLNQPQVVPPNTDGPATQEAPLSPPSEVSLPPDLEKAQQPDPSPPGNIPLSTPLPVQGPATIKHQPNPASTENQTPELTPTPVVQEEPTPTVTPSLLHMVKLRSLNSSPEPPKSPEQPEAEVTMRIQQPGSQVPTSSASGDAPQKPIRRSMIMISPTSTSPPAIVTSQPALSKSQAIVVPPASSSRVISPTKKSPSAMTASPSMNLQEAIRLRTAARSKDGPTSRLSLHSPTSPIDPHKSPTSTASFIFSKSNKKVVIETKPATQIKATVQKNLEISAVARMVNETESLKKGVKVPPPVAKKPKTKGKEIETSEGTEQTAGQEALQESIKDAAEKTNGTAGTVEGGGAPST